MRCVSRLQREMRLIRGKLARSDFSVGVACVLYNRNFCKNILLYPGTNEQGSDLTDLWQIFKEIETCRRLAYNL